MLRPSTGFAAAATTLASVAALALGFGLARHDRAAQPPAQAKKLVLVPVVEGGMQQGGYLNGRPIPSGFDLPLVIRWKAEEQSVVAEGDPAFRQKRSYRGS